MPWLTRVSERPKPAIGLKALAFNAAFTPPCCTVTPAPSVAVVAALASQGSLVPMLAAWPAAPRVMLALLSVSVPWSSSDAALPMIEALPLAPAAPVICELPARVTEAAAVPRLRTPW